MSGFGITGHCHVCGNRIYNGERFASIDVVKFIGYDQYLSKMSENVGIYCLDCCRSRIEVPKMHDHNCSCCGAFIGDTKKSWKIRFGIGVVDLEKKKALGLRNETIRSFCVNCAEKKRIHDAVYHAIRYVIRPQMSRRIPKLDRSGDPVKMNHLDFCPNPMKS